MAQARGEKATVGDILEANKSLRFLKQSADIPLRFEKLGEMSELRIGIYTDASWASRPDGSSQAETL